jgi:aspartate/methionine/tyrosine aminotransferase
LYLNIFNNPTGECYSRHELTEIVQWARAADIAIIVDKVSADLTSDMGVPNILDIAYEQDFIDDIVIVSSISKDRSLPGLRAGWIIGPTRLIVALADYVNQIAIAPSSLTAVSVFVDMLCRTLEYLADRSTGSVPGMMTVAETFVEQVLAFAPLAPDVGDFMALYTDVAYLQTMIERYRAWHAGLLDLLQYNWLLIADAYSSDLITGAEWQGGFNTFVRVPVIDHVDPYQFTTDLFRQEGIQILPGPCFWSKPPACLPEPCFWMRVSFAMDTAKLDDGLTRSIEFAKEYRG